MTARVEKLTMKAHHVDAHVAKSWANEEHCNNKQVDQSAKVKVPELDLDWQHQGELFLDRGPVMPPVIRGDMRHADGLVTAG